MNSFEIINRIRLERTKRLKSSVTQIEQLALYICACGPNEYQDSAEYASRIRQICKEIQAEFNQVTLDVQEKRR